MTTAGAAFALSGLLTLVLAFVTDADRLILGALAALSGAVSLALLALARHAGDRAPSRIPDDEPFDQWTLGPDQPPSG